MSSNGQTVYELRHLSSAAQAIKELAKTLPAGGPREAFVSAMRIIIEKLQTEPSKWGDPEYNLRKPGGCVYHGILDPVIVKYAVYEHEKIVLLMKVRVFSAG